MIYLPIIKTYINPNNIVSIEVKRFKSLGDHIEVWVHTPTGEHIIHRHDHNAQCIDDTETEIERIELAIERHYNK